MVQVLYSNRIPFLNRCATCQASNKVAQLRIRVVSEKVERANHAELPMSRIGVRGTWLDLSDLLVAIPHSASRYGDTACDCLNEHAQLE
jgi:hypothetical protein